MKSERITAFDEETLIWYAAYGSNLSESRFHCYIKGGTPAGSSKSYLGCKDTSLPQRLANIQIDRALYFAKESKSWANGGVGFISTVPSPSHNTLCRMYLITVRQFTDVVKQEINHTGQLELNYAAAANKGSHIFKPGSWYGNLICLGTSDGMPIFTFTHETDIRPFNKPSAPYLKLIMEGVAEAHKHLSAPQIVEYIYAKPGVTGNYSPEELLSLMCKK